MVLAQWLCVLTCKCKNNVCYAVVGTGIRRLRGSAPWRHLGGLPMECASSPPGSSLEATPRGGAATLRAAHGSGFDPRLRMNGCSSCGRRWTSTVRFRRGSMAEVISTARSQAKSGGEPTNRTLLHRICRRRGHQQAWPAPPWNENGGRLEGLRASLIKTAPRPENGRWLRSRGSD